MKKQPIPPIPKIQLPENFEPLSIEEFEKTDAYKKHIVPFLQEQKNQQKTIRRQWFKNNWLNLLGVVIGILTLIATILFGLLQLSN